MADCLGTEMDCYLGTMMAFHLVLSLVSPILLDWALHLVQQMGYYLVAEKAFHLALLKGIVMVLAMEAD